MEETLFTLYTLFNGYLKKVFIKISFQHPLS
jgi:hypothetical protein